MSFLRLLSSICALVALALVANAASAADDPQKILARQELVPIVPNVWGTSDELKLQEIASELPKLKEPLLVLQRDLQQRMEANSLVWGQQGITIKAMESSLAKLSPSDPGRQPLLVQIAQARSQTIEPEKLAGQFAVQQRLIELIEVRNAISIAILESDRLLAAMMARYADLEKDEAVTAALRAIDKGARLGPARSLENHRRRLAEYEKLVFTTSVPVYLQSGRLRVSAIAGDRLPVTFTFQNNSAGESTMITSSVAESLDVVIDRKVAPLKVEVAPKRVAMVRETTISYLRLGRFTTSGVRVLVLPPECEDLGCTLARGTLSGHSVKVDLPQFRMVIDGE